MSAPTATDLDAAFDDLAGFVDPAMVIVTANDGDADAGCLVGFHSQTSISPQRWGVWISRANRTHEVVMRAERVGIHFLSAADRELAELFGGETGDEIDKFASCDVVRRHGVPMLASCHAWMVGDVVGLHADGDHTCVVVAPAAIGENVPERPLRLADVDGIEPGHQP